MVFNISKIGVSAVSFGINKAVVYDENMPWAPKILFRAAKSINSKLYSRHQWIGCDTLWYHFLW